MDGIDVHPTRSFMLDTLPHRSRPENVSLTITSTVIRVECDAAASFFMIAKIERNVPMPYVIQRKICISTPP
jgi:hypothetical protein